MPPIAEVQRETEDAVVQEQKDVAPSKPTIGIIYPPPELRNIVDKTASFVARNGPEFEARIRQNEINNQKFNFLNPGDPYHAYYQHKVKEFKEGKGAPEPVPATPLKPTPAAPAPKPEAVKAPEQAVVPKEPPPEYEFWADPPSISAFDLDVVKLTAQFVARNGRQFLTNLMNREQRNYQFDFLRPQHSLFNYFTKLLEQYTKILIPHKSLMAKLKNEAESPKSILEQVRYRVEWTKHQEEQKRREEEEAERERVQYAQIDWHDFVVVETVDYQPNEQGLFPPPTTPDEVGKRVLAQERGEEGEEVEMEVESEDEDEGGEKKSEKEKETPTVTSKPGIDNTQVQDMEEESSSEDESEDRPQKPPSPPPQPPKEAPPLPPPLPPQPGHVVVRKDYDPKSAKAQKAASDQYLISPITGEKIPADKLQDHVRIGLLDPRWVEQRDRSVQEKLQQEEVYAAGSAIESSLKQFAERRTDIFGVGVEETAIGKKIGEEEQKKPEKVTWDGHTASMEAATRAARANITIEEQIQQIHKIKGLLPDEEKEKIGPSKPQDNAPPLPPLPPNPPVSSVSLSSQASTIKPPPPPSSVSPSAPKPVAPVNHPPSTSSDNPPMTVNTPRPPMPHMPLPPQPGGPMMMHPPQPMMGPPPQGLLMTPIGGPPPHHMGPPPMMAIHQQHSLGPGGPFGPPVGMPQPPPPDMSMQNSTMKPPSQMNEDEEPPTKKQKTEESLIPEEEFLQKNKSPVSFRVQLPNISEKAEWKLNGQIVTLTLPLTDMVSVIKAKIHDETGMPPGKQKLQYDGMFIKDSNTLAYYNVLQGGTVLLQVKERGGRKK